MDFADLKRLTHTVLDDLDHKHINELEYFKEHNPSSEEIARFIFFKLKNLLMEHSCNLQEVRVWETDTSCAVYFEA